MSKRDRKYKKPRSPLPSKVTEEKHIPVKIKFCKPMIHAHRIQI